MQPARSTTWEKIFKWIGLNRPPDSIDLTFCFVLCPAAQYGIGIRIWQICLWPGTHTRTVSRWWSARYSNESLNSTTPGPPFHAGPPTACELHLLRIFSLVSVLFSPQATWRDFFISTKIKKIPFRLIRITSETEQRSLCNKRHNSKEYLKDNQ